MKNEQPIAFFSSKIGEGNPLAVLAAQAQLQATGIPTVLKLADNPISRLAAWKQSLITGDEQKRLDYNANYDRVRTSLPAKVLGLLNLLELSAFIHRSKAKKLVLAQELPLALLADLELPLVSAILAKLEEIIILVPDVYSKNGALSTTVKLQNSGKNVTLAVWNKAAQERLQQHGIRHHLIKPWLIPDSAKPITSNQAPLSIIRPSGTGINPKYMGAIAAFLAQERPQQIGQHLLGSSVTTHYNRRGQKTATHHHSPHSLMKALITALRANPEVVFAYPSEMVQVITQFRQKGWQGKYYMFPERGLHEVENGIFAAIHGIGQALALVGNKFELKKDLKPVPINAINDLVGHQSLSQIIK